MNQNKKLRVIIVYTSNDCPKCAMLKNWLKNRGLGFEERTLDMEVTADLIMKNVVVLSAPVLEVEGAFYTEDQIFDGDRLLASQFLRRLGG